MFDLTIGGVVITNGQSGVCLSKLGPLIPYVGYPTFIEIRAGTFTGSVSEESVGYYPRFLEELRALYKEMSGTASLGSSNDAFTCILAGDGRGAIAVSVELRELSPLVRLVARFGIDQSYLPAIIQGVHDEFPEK